MSGLIKKIVGTLEKPRHPYVESSYEFMELDLTKAKKELNIENEAKERGQKDLPSTDSVNFDGTEQKIVNFIETEKVRNIEYLNNNLLTFKRRLETISIGNKLEKINEIISKTINDYRAEIHGGLDILYQQKRDVIHIDNEIRIFTKNHKLDRMAHYPESSILLVSVLIVLVVIESFMNGFFLAKGNEYGQMGGIFEASILSIINVAVGCLFGRKVIPSITYRSFFAKLFSLTGIVVYIASIVLFNLVVAHYRDALGIVSLEEVVPQKYALQTFLASPTGIDDIKSWMLFFVGCVSSFVACIDSFFFDDKYPGYGKISRRQKQLLDDYGDTKKELMDDLKEIRDQAIDDIEIARKKIESSKGEINGIIEHRKRLRNSFDQRVNSLEHTANELLKFYRDINESNRTTPRPEYFKESWKITHTETNEYSAQDDEDYDSINDEIIKIFRDIPEQTQKVHSEYEVSFKKYKMIDELTAENLDAWQEKIKEN